MMHPRNLYNKPPDFSELRIQFPEFASKVKIDIDGKSKLDFKDPESVRVLTQCCLKKDFKLKINLPVNKLLPTLPLRLNYIHWIEDILDYCLLKENVIGVDIGTGASCIYCLLAVRLNTNWKMFALEIDDENIKFARENVANNELENQIKVIDQDKSEKIFQKLFEHDSGQKTFTICNPPFFSSANQLQIGQNRTGKRKRQSSGYLEASSETVFFEGGELGFVTKILEESLKLKGKIEIYSTMFGCKKNFQSFVTKLKCMKIDNFTTTELVQGKVVRWAIAWSFSKSLNNFMDQAKVKQNEKTADNRKSNILTFAIKDMEFKAIHEKIIKIFEDLRITTKVLKREDEQYYCYELEALENTWSNQRRKRRAEMRNEEMTSKNSSSSASLENLQMGFELSRNENESIVKMFFINGTMSKDCVNQVLQCIKNRIKLDR